MSQGGPAKTTLAPAYLSYRTAFRDYGSGPEPQAPISVRSPDHRVWKEPSRSVRW